MKVIGIDDKIYEVTNQVRIDTVSDLSSAKKHIKYDTLVTIDGWYLFCTEMIEAEFTEVESKKKTPKRKAPEIHIK